MPSSVLDLLKQWTVIVADTGDFEQLKRYKPQDATTNPTLILQASQLPQYAPLVTDTIEKTQAEFPGLTQEDLVNEICDQLGVAFGCEILKIVPGVVSTEIDARLSFDTEASIRKAKRLVNLYAQKGISKERLLIKMASTWEGCRAAEVLESQGIHTNLTLLFSFCQAVAAAEANAYLISPFVGRILDWHKKNTGKDFSASEDPGVLSVRKIYSYYKKHGYSTIVMGASFRNTGEIIALAGCDRLTISPPLLGELEAMNSEGTIKRLLSPDVSSAACTEPKVVMDEKTFRWMLNEDAMATEKLAEGIRNFSADLLKLKTFVASKLDKQ